MPDKKSEKLLARLDAELAGAARAVHGFRTGRRRKRETPTADPRTIASVKDAFERADGHLAKVMRTEDVSKAESSLVKACDEIHQGLRTAGGVEDIVGDKDVHAAMTRCLDGLKDRQMGLGRFGGQTITRVHKALESLALALKIGAPKLAADAAAAEEERALARPKGLLTYCRGWDTTDSGVDVFNRLNSTLIQAADFPVQWKTAVSKNQLRLQEALLLLMDAWHEAIAEIVRGPNNRAALTAEQVQTLQKLHAAAVPPADAGGALRSHRAVGLGLEQAQQGL